jgi:hypothetical protein
MNKIINTFFLVVIIACSGKPKLKKEVAKPIERQFNINGTLSNFYTNRVYLNRFKDNNYFPIDSAAIEDNTFTFTGSVPYPERYVLTFKNYTAEIILILENCELNIEINQLQLNNPTITGSELNVQLNDYQLATKKIFNKIDHLFPEFQTARLENDVQKLKEIREKMNEIEAEYTEFSFDYIENNQNSYLAPMILRDLLKTPPVDSLKVERLFRQFPDSIQQSRDSRIIADYLDLP